LTLNITVFGGSQPKEGDDAYQEALDLGRLLAHAGHTVLTGGYIGTMEAVSCGASLAGGHVIGVTCDEIEKWHPVRPNAWIKEERRYETLQERLNALIQGCDAAIALPGGPGTLTEIALTWNLMIVESLPRRPLVLVGKGWQAVLSQFMNSFDTYLPNHQRELLQFAPDASTAVKLVSAES
jgi:uncharacterized protein (TIGR00730 family)